MPLQPPSLLRWLSLWRIGYPPRMTVQAEVSKSISKHELEEKLPMKKILVVVLSLAMFCTACSTAWVSTLDSILAAAAPALINILQIVAVANGQPVNSALAAKINADATAIKTLAADFASA